MFEMHIIHIVCFPYAFQSLRFNFVTNSRITHLTSINSKNAHVNVFACKDMKFDQIHIIALKDSPNIDGIHIGSFNNVQILDSTIATGDDCVSMSPGSKNINIRNVTCGPGHGISVGSLGGGPNEEDVSGLTVTNCTFIGTQNGLRVKTWARSYASNVSILSLKTSSWIMSTTLSSLINNIAHLAIVKRYLALVQILLYVLVLD